MANVVICMPSTALIPVESVQSLIEVYRFGVDAGHVAHPPLFYSGPGIDTARNMLVERARRLEATHIFWMDSDMIVPQNAIAYMVEQEHRILSGLYFLRRPPYHAVAYYLDESGAQQPIDAVHPIDPDGQYIVDAVGSGCLLVAMELYDAYSYVHTAQCDDSFHFSLWARDAGYKIHLDAALACGHMSTQPITIIDHRRQSERLLRSS